MKRKLPQVAAVFATLVILPTALFASNIAYNPSLAGFPSPLESDPGWGGGSYPWHLVDGLRSYDTWASGLAFLWDYQDHQATIAFSAAKSFDKVILWHHGTSYTPVTTFLDYWDGDSWESIAFNRLYGTMHEEGTGSGYSDSDIYTFNPVTSSKVRYSFDGSPGLAIDGNPFIHGWLYEFEVFESTAVPEPSSLILSVAGIAGLFAIRKRIGALRS